jgi:hypothetical protein
MSGWKLITKTTSSDDVVTEVWEYTSRGRKITLTFSYYFSYDKVYDKVRVVGLNEIILKTRKTTYIFIHPDDLKWFLLDHNIPKPPIVILK